MKKRGTWIILVIALLLATGGGYAAYARYATPADEEPPEPTLETATVTRGDLVITAEGSGEIVPTTELELTFQTGGVLEAILVDVGDPVDEGQVLARLETEQLERALAEADVEVELTQRDLADVRDGADEADIADAQAKLQDARVSLTLAQDAYENTVDSRLDAVTERAQDTYNWYVGYYQKMKSRFEAGEISQTEHDHAMNAMVKAEGQLTRATNEALSEQTEARSRIQQAQNSVTQALNTLETLQSEPLTDTLLRAELAVDEALVAREQARVDLEAAQLYAPFDGIVMDVAATVGAQVGTNTAILTLADLQDPLLSFWLEEADLAHVAIGSTVNVVFEALPDDTFTGQVLRVDPLLVTVDNTPAVQAWARIDRPQDLALLSGMTADVEVIAAQASDTLLVPVAALQQTSSGETTVSVVAPDGALETRPVTVGLQDFTYAQILNGLEGGEIVSLQP